MARGKKTGGRSAGTPNKATKELKDMIQGALDAKGGQAWLEQQMDESPAAFMTLLGKILPKDVNVGGQKDNPVVSTIKLVAMNGDERS